MLFRCLFGALSHERLHKTGFDRSGYCGASCFVRDILVDSPMLKEDKMKFVIFDIDNCISNDLRRQKHLPKSESPVESDFYAYHADADKDETINSFVLNAHISQSVKASLRPFSSETADMIVFITSRPERYRKQTEDWVKEKFLMIEMAGAPDWTILMRPSGSTLDSPKLKVALFEKLSYEELGSHKAGWAQVIAAYDDREDILRAYQAQGVEACIKLSLKDYFQLKPFAEPELKFSVERDVKTPKAAGAAKQDVVNSPAHYINGQIETIEMIIDLGDGEGFCRGNVIKYLSRFRDKNGLEDLKKAQWYLNKLIEIVGEKE